MALTTEVETQEHALPEARPDSGINTDADASQGYPTVSDDAETVTGQDDGLRRSARSRRAPDRLQVQTWKGQTYTPGSSSEETAACYTACQSVFYSDCLHPVRPDGGEGINDGDTMATQAALLINKQTVQCY